MATVLRLNELTREEVLGIAPRATVVLPVASTEQHGPHLPLLTDCALGETIALRSVEHASKRIPVLLAPVLPFGNSQHHLFACALSLRSTTLLAVLNDLADSLVASGFKRLFVLNSHGGNDECVKLLAKDLVLRHDVAIAACSYWEVGEASAKEVGAAELGAYPGHAGGFETAIMMAVAPSLVRQSRLPREVLDPPAVWSRKVAPGLVIQKAGEWERIGGYSDAPTKATPQLGAKLLDAISLAVGEAIVAFHNLADYR